MSSSQSKKHKNSAGNRSDVGWKYGVAIDETGRKIKCKFCEKEITGGVYRLKHHLAGTQKDVGACKAVSDEVKKEMLAIVCPLQEKLSKKSNIDVDEEEETYAQSSTKRKMSGSGEGSTNPLDVFKKRRTQNTINSILKKDLREEASQEIASFFYNNAIPFNVANSDEYHKMLELVARHGSGFKAPSSYELRVKYLKMKVESTKEDLEEHKAFWKKTGCTIMTDGWTDQRRRTIINFLVHSTMGTVFLKSIDASHISKTADAIFKMIDEVVDEIGEENVVQVVTDNAANYKAAGEKLMEKRKHLYWTPCAAHCIDLMLEDFEKKLPVHSDTIPKGKKITTFIYSRTSLITLLQHFTKGKELVRPAMTRFATSYITLGCLHDNKSALLSMFNSNQWRFSRYAKTRDGKFVEDVVMDREFWKNVVICLKGAYPLISVLRLVDSDEKPAMGYIYEEMDRAKEKIANAFKSVQRSYMPIWEIIDDRWDKQLHRPLHAAGYYLNPQMHYSPQFKVDYEVKRGLYDCLERLSLDLNEVEKIDAQIEDFKYKRKFFGSAIAKRAIQNKSPAEWWESYGDEHPELQKFAIRVLSLTCSSSGCERNWSAFEMVHTKRRNRLKQKTMNDVVFVMANSRLKKKKKVRTPADYTIDDFPSDDDWIVENEESSSNIDLDAQNNEDLVELQPLDDQNLDTQNDEVVGLHDVEIPTVDDALDVDVEGEGEGEEDSDLNALID